MYPVLLTDDIDRRVEEELILVGVHGATGVVAIQLRFMIKIIAR
jgi:hypothetical protein